MKALYFEEQAVRYLAQASSFQSGEFEDAVKLVKYLRTGENTTIKRVNCVTSKNIGFICNRYQTSALRALIIDLTKMNGIYEYDDNSLVTIILKMIKFSVKRWDNIQLSDSEKYIDNNHAILFPFPYSEKHPVKILINLSPAPDFSSKRGISYLYAAGIGENRFDVYYSDILNIKAIRDDASAVFNQNTKLAKDKNEDIDALQVTELGEINKKMTGFWIMTNGCIVCQKNNMILWLET